ncbi:MAG: cation/H(+) antiporter [Acidobacteria bacterium]|nr:MAG: cation/H(+) antiporter [Acidobacteriota bacterium]
MHVLLALTAVVITGRVLGKLLASIGQPPVVGDILAGILLGPSLLGRVSPDLAAVILPRRVAPSLSVIAQLGIVLYMFLVGLELDAGKLRGRARTMVVISHASIVVPFTLGVLLASPLYADLAPPGVSFIAFALFIGVAMSITAFPVLARILTDGRMAHTELGVTALTCAAVDDVTAWCLLAFVAGVARAAVGDALMVVLLTLGFIGVMFLIARPLAARALARTDRDPPSHEAIALTFVGVLASALTTERIGIHAIFGAFLFGAIVPSRTALARALVLRLRDVVTILLLPAFFAFTGMRTEIGLLSGPREWAMCGAVVLVATAGKFGGTFVAAWLTGREPRFAAALGILMNTRGLMELIVLNVGLDLGVISPALFTMMVLMAVVTTLATTPALRLVWKTPRGS